MQPSTADSMQLSMKQIVDLIGEQDAHDLLNYTSTKIPKKNLHLPSPTYLDTILSQTDRSIPVLRSWQQMFQAGRLSGTGYLSILPVDQGIEHSAGASFAANPEFFDPENIIKLAIEGGCNAVATTLGTLKSCARKYAHKIPFILKINHNQILSYPNQYDQTLFSQVDEAWDMGCTAIGATIYFGSPESNRQIQEISQVFHQAHQRGMGTILWCYLRNNHFKVDGVDYHTSADLTGQANHLGVTIGADLIKQKLPENNGGYEALNQNGKSFGKFSEKMYTELSTPHPIDLCRYQVANCYMGRIGLINSGGPSGKDDLKAAVKTAIINKRAGGMGLISGRKAFQKPFNEGVKLLHAIQDVYLNPQITIA